MESAEAVYAFFEVVIVGGGIAGLSAADMLYKNGITVGLFRNLFISFKMLIMRYFLKNVWLLNQFYRFV